MGKSIEYWGSVVKEKNQNKKNPLRSSTINLLSDRKLQTQKMPDDKH